MVLLGDIPKGIVDIPEINGNRFENRIGLAESFRAERIAFRERPAAVFTDITSAFPVNSGRSAGNIKVII